MSAHIVVLGAGLNGLIAASRLAKAGHRVTIIERKRSAGFNWVGWKRLLAAETTCRLLDGLGIKYSIVDASIGLWDGQQVKDLRSVHEVDLEVARTRYAIRTRRWPVDHGNRLPLQRKFLQFNMRKLIEALSDGLESDEQYYGFEIQRLEKGFINCRIPSTPDVDFHFKPDFVISTIPLWTLAYLMGVQPLLCTAVPMRIHWVNSDAYPEYHYIYTPYCYCITRLSRQKDHWQVEAIDDNNYTPVAVKSEINELLGVVPYSERIIPGQLLPPEVEWRPEFDNWFLMGRHAAWNSKETIDISIERFEAWAKDKGLLD